LHGPNVHFILHQLAVIVTSGQLIDVDGRTDLIKVTDPQAAPGQEILVAVSMFLNLGHALKE
jgi:hypothetical protein